MMHTPHKLTLAELEQLTAIAQQNFATVLIAYLDTTRETVAVLRDFVEGKEPESVGILIALHNKMKLKADATEALAEKMGLVK